MSSHTFKEMSVDSILPSKDNARQFDPKDQDFKDLVESIRVGGVRIPIHIWPHPKKDGKYEIRAGERRWRASKSLKLKTIPSIVHLGITYQVAMTLTYVENKFRKSLAPLEEVEEIARGMDGLKSDAKLLADLLGQTEQWVRLRANIHKNLVHEWRQAFLDKEKFAFFNKWTIGHLTLIARLPAVSQKELLKNIQTYQWQWREISVHDLDRRLSEALRLLNKAKWNLDDATLLPKAGPCCSCHKRSGSQPVLWYGSVSEQNLSKDRCLDTQCWEKKMQLYLQQRAKLLSEKHTNLAYISTDYLSSNDKEELSKTFGRVLDKHDVQKSTKGSKNVVPALVVRGNGTGGVIYVKENQFVRPAGARSEGKVTPLKERRAMLQSKRYAQVLIVLREMVEKASVDRLVYKDKITGVMALAALYGNQPYYTVDVNAEKSDKLKQKQIADLVKSTQGSDNKSCVAARLEAVAFLWESIKPTLDNLLTYGGPVTQTTDYVISNAKWIAELIQVDLDKIFKEVSKAKGFTEPKSWKGLNADGTPKKKKTTPAGSKRKSSKAQKEETKKKINQSKIIAAQKIGLKVDMSDEAESRADGI